jgi:hypothetical protein
VLSLVIHFFFNNPFGGKKENIIANIFLAIRCSFRTSRVRQADVYLTRWQDLFCNHI